MRVYYAHAMVLYGTELEKAEAEIIRARLPGYEVVDPGEYESNPEKSEQAMRYCFKLIDGCDALAFSRLLGKITSGVGLEVNYALACDETSELSVEGRYAEALRLLAKRNGKTLAQAPRVNLAGVLAAPKIEETQT